MTPNEERATVIGYDIGYLTAIKHAMNAIAQDYRPDEDARTRALRAEFVERIGCLKPDSTPYQPGATRGRPRRGNVPRPEQ